MEFYTIDLSKYTVKVLPFNIILITHFLDSLIRSELLVVDFENFYFKMYGKYLIQRSLRRLNLHLFDILDVPTLYIINCVKH